MKKLVIVLCLSLALMSCHPAFHPGAPTQAASDIFGALRIADGVINEARKDFLDGSLPISGRPVFNALNDSYRAAAAALDLYSTAAQTVPNPPNTAQLLATVTRDINTMNTNMAAVQSLLKGKK